MSTATRDELMQVLRALPDSVALMAADRTFRYVNQGREGYDVEAIVGTDALDYVAPGAKRDFAETFDRALQTGAPVAYEVPVVVPTGEPRWYEGVLIPVFEDDRVNGVVAVTRRAAARRRSGLPDRGSAELVRVCAWCDRVRHEGEWRSLDEYLRETRRVSVSHALCPDCAQRLGESEE